MEPIRAFFRAWEVVENISFWRKGNLPVKKINWPFFPALPSMKKLRKQFVGVQKVFWQLLWNFYEHFLGTMNLLKTQIFEKKAKFPVRKRFWPIFPVLSNMTNVKLIFLGSSRYFGIYCANVEIILLGHRKSIGTNVSETGCFHNQKSFWPILPSIIECDKPQRTFYKSQQVFPTIAV